ncbi:MAG: hypothetical protein ACRDIA_08440, partial [Actinomycetota bacterium]
AAASPAATPTGPSIERAAPGSIALKLRSYTSTPPGCTFNADDVIVVYFGRSTQFDPDSLLQNNKFPNNLQGVVVRITGEVLAVEGECFLAAATVSVTEEAPSPSPTSRTTTRRRATPTPSPTRTSSPSPTAAATSPAATATTQAAGSSAPNAAGDDGESVDGDEVDEPEVSVSP